MTRVRPVAEMLDELAEELRHGKIIEARLNDPTCHLDGLCEAGSIVIDPAPGLVETLLHELLHRRYGSWSERRVDREAHRILEKMTQAQIGVWYRRYQRAKRIRKRAVQTGIE